MHKAKFEIGDKVAYKNPKFDGIFEVTGIQFDSQMRRVMYNVKNHIGTWKEAECDLITDIQMERENKLKILLD